MNRRRAEIMSSIDDLVRSQDELLDKLMGETG